MDFTVDRDSLEKNLHLMHGVVETKITMPILANILLHAEGEELVIRATDLEIGLENSVPCEVSSVGTTTLNARKLLDIVKSLPEGKIRFVRASESGVTITSGGVRYDLVEMQAVDFPRLPDFPASYSISLPTETVLGLFKRIVFNLAAEEPQQNRGCLLVMNPGSLILVATDGHRLTYIKQSGKDLTMPADVPEYRMILHRKAILTLMKIDHGSAIEMEVGENHVFFRAGGNALSARLQELKFPKYEKVIPRDHDKRLTIVTEDFLEGLKRVILITSDRMRPTQLSLSSKGVLLSSISPESGKAEAFIPAHFAGSSLDIQFNAQYLVEFLQAVGSEQITLDLKDVDKAALLKPVGDLPYEYLYVLMPMRT